MNHPIINLFKTEWGYLGKRRKIFLFYMFMFVIAGVVELAIPYLIGNIFNSIQESLTTRADLNILLLKISMLLGITIVFWLFHGTARVLEVTTSFFVKKNYINDKIRIVLKLPVKWHKDHHSGDTIDKINRASSGLESFSGEMTYQIVYSIINYLGSIILLIFIDWKIGIFSLLFSVFTIFIISKVDKNLNERYKELNKYSNRLSASIFDYISNIITVITLRLKKTVSKEIDIKQIASYPAFRSSTVINELKWGFASVAIRLMVVLTLCYKAYNDFNTIGVIMIGTLYMLFGYLNKVGDTFYKFASLYGSIIRANTRVTGAYPLDQEYIKLKELDAGRLPKNWKTIEMKNVSFTYDKKSKIIHLQNIDFTFDRGQKIALVGESGSGKSTILSLIRGLYNPENEEIYCDGKRIKDGVKTIREHVTLIPQEPEVFNNTFLYNITMNLTTTDEELNRAIEMAQLKPVLEKLPKGLKTNVMEKGVSLSGGEKQRLALARGLLAAKKSDILLLDEPTSSVDNLNEIKIHESIFENFNNKTIISSIHRLHLLDKFDYIYLFSKGKIIGQGTFNEIKKNLVFNKMWIKYTKEKVIDREHQKNSK